MSSEIHPINQCHFGHTIKTLEEKIEWQNRRIAGITRRVLEHFEGHDVECRWSHEGDPDTADPNCRVCNILCEPPNGAYVTI